MLNPGQMLLWHVVLLPLGVGVIVVLHIVLVRRHGVVPPLDADERGAVDMTTAAARSRRRPTRRTRTTFPTRPYDLVKEFVIALAS